MSHTLLLWPLHVRSCIFTLTLPSKTSNGCFFPLFPFNQFYAIVLLLFANVIRLRQGYGSLSAPVDRSELLISSSIHVTFAKAERPKQAPLERSTLQDSEKASAGLKKKTTVLAEQPDLFHCCGCRLGHFSFSNDDSRQSNMERCCTSLRLRCRGSAC